MTEIRSPDCGARPVLADDLTDRDCPDCGAPAEHLEHGLAAAFRTFTTNVSAEPASADRDRRLQNLKRLAVEIAAPQPSRERA